MNPNGPSRLRQPSATSDRILGTRPHAPPVENFLPSSSSAADVGGELNEDEIFATEISHTPPPSSPPTRHVQRLERSRSRLKTVEVSGIRAALPGPSSGDNLHGHVYHHKSALSTSASPSSSLSSARAIPSVPKPPQERLRFPSSVDKHHQSAPMNVPVLSPAMIMSRRRRDLDPAEVDDKEAEREMLPPHEIVARSLAQSPRISCSVLEGAGRTLKGRDLRQGVFRMNLFIPEGFVFTTPPHWGGLPRGFGGVARGGHGAGSRCSG